MSEPDEPLTIVETTPSAHASLVKRAEQWLRCNAALPGYSPGRVQRVRCGVVVTEAGGTFSAEMPDAIGWAYGANRSILIECKTSRNDFLADAMKPFRCRPQDGMGHHRYFLTPPGLLKPHELPSLWGLLETTGKRVRIVQIAASQPAINWHAERQLLYAAASRLRALVDSDVESAHRGVQVWRREYQRLGREMFKLRDELTKTRGELLALRYGQQ